MKYMLQSLKKRCPELSGIVCYVSGPLDFQDSNFLKDITKHMGDIHNYQEAV